MSTSTVAALLAAIPEGFSKASYGGRTYGISKTQHNGGRSIKLYAAELGGNDFVSLNFYRTQQRDWLKPCEMPTAKVLDFLRGQVPMVEGNGQTLCRNQDLQD